SLSLPRGRGGRRRGRPARSRPGRPSSGHRFRPPPRRAARGSTPLPPSPARRAAPARPGWAGPDPAGGGRRLHPPALDPRPAAVEAIQLPAFGSRTRCAAPPPPSRAPSRRPPPRLLSLPPSSLRFLSQIHAPSVSDTRIRGDMYPIFLDTAQNVSEAYPRRIRIRYISDTRYA